MTFTPHTAAQRAAMLNTIGVRDFSELLGAIPRNLLLQRELEVPQLHGEADLMLAAQEVLAENSFIPVNRVFAGGGIYPHFVPAVVDAISSRGEFLTAYTPYQPEVSQGYLQSIYEYQTYICLLTGMDVSNASGYDGGTTLADAVVMAWHYAKGKRSRVLVVPSVNPKRLGVARTYGRGLGIEFEEVAADGLESALGDDVAAVVFQYPDYHGCLQDKLEQLIAAAHTAGALAIVSFYPVAAGLLKTPGELGADIVCGEGQCLGNRMAFGGPVLGFLACTDKLIRQLPGRLIGRTICERRDNPGDEFSQGEGFVMTLQAREQHIRRDKAQSNICTNQALLALRSCIYLGLVGRTGFIENAQQCHANACAAFDALVALPGVESLHPGANFFNEFTLRFPPGKADEIYDRALEQRMLAGFKPDDAEGCLAFAFTEIHRQSDIEALVEVVREVL